MMEFTTNHALGKTFRQFGYINHACHLGFEDEMILYAHDLDQLQIMWEAYKYFFNVKREPTFAKEGPNQIDFADYYRNTTKENIWNVCKLHLKNPIEVTHPIVYSIIDIKNSEKGIDSKSKNNIIKHLSGVDLGDSRNFKSADELIYKVTQLASAETFIGSSCSWAFLCPYFDTTWIRIQEIELNYL